MSLLAFRPRRAVLLAAALAGACLQAQEFLGFQAYFVLPQSETAQWTGKGPGFGLGLHQVRDLGNGSAFRTRLDACRFQGRRDLAVPTGAGPVTVALDNRISQLTAMLESMYYFDGYVDSGAYLFGGLGLASTTLESRGSADPAATAWPGQGTLKDTNNRPAYSLGFGFQRNHAFGGEVRYVSTFWQRGAVRLRVHEVTLGVTYRLP